MASLKEYNVQIYLGELRDILLANPSKKNKLKLEIYHGSNIITPGILEVESKRNCNSPAKKFILFRICQRSQDRQVHRFEALFRK